MPVPLEVTVEREEIAVGTAAFDEFQKLPWKVYGSDPRWIPSNPEYEAAQLAEGFPFRRYGELQAFAARHDGELVARAVAMLNPRIQAPEQPVGLVGFFDSVDDYDAARTVLEAAVDWLREHGAKTIWGPMNFSLWHAYRFMTRGFETIPFLGEPYNKRWYPEYFERFGFERTHRWRSWDLAEPHMRGLLAGAMAVPREALAQAGFTAEIVTPDTFDAFMPRVHAILNDGFSENFGYARIDLDEFAFTCEPLRPLLVPGASPAMVFDPAGAPCAYGYVYPDLGPQVRAATGLPEPELNAMSNPYRGPRIVLHTMVVVKKYRKQGIVNAVLGQEMMPRMLDNGFTQGVGAVAKEGRTGYDKVGEPTREYHLYALA